MGGGDVRVVGVDGGTSPEAVHRAYDLVRAQLAGAAPALAPIDPRRLVTHATSPGDVAHRERAPSPPELAPAGTAVLLATSGSSGGPRLVALGLAALQHHARAAHARLGGPGRWLLALPLHHVAGWQVLMRSAVAESGAPAVLDTSAGFRTEDLARVVDGMDAGGPRYASLVPTQLVRVLADAAATRALARLDAVLLGGAAAQGRLLERAHDAGVTVVETYGLTESGGGCVYDGVPLDGVEVVENGGRLEIGGPTLATGYLAPGGSFPVPDDVFLVRDGRRWVRTADLGTVDDAGRVRVLGRADDVIVTGGVNVHPVAVERALVELPSVEEAVVVGLPDDEWGAAVTAVVVPHPGAHAPDLATLRAHVRSKLGAAHAPRQLAVVGHLPLRGPGKIDRAAAARLAADILARPGGEGHRAG
jgi:O-succinylbenzoic acid--CoA ligase